MELVDLWMVILPVTDVKSNIHPLANMSSWYMDLVLGFRSLLIRFHVTFAILKVHRKRHA